MSDRDAVRKELRAQLVEAAERLRKLSRKHREWLASLTETEMDYVDRVEALSLVEAKVWKLLHGAVDAALEELQYSDDPEVRHMSPEDTARILKLVADGYG